MPMKGKKVALWIEKNLGLTYRNVDISNQSTGKRDGLELERMYAPVAIINNSLVWHRPTNGPHSSVYKAETVLRAAPLEWTASA